MASLRVVDVHTCAYAQTFFCFVVTLVRNSQCAYVSRAESVVVMVVGVRYELYKVKIIFPKKGTHGREYLIDVSAPGTASHSLTEQVRRSAYVPPQPRESKLCLG